jgi:hypothetical protein
MTMRVSDLNDLGGKKRLGEADVRREEEWA